MTGVITAARMGSVSEIARVESVATCLNPMQSPFVVRAVEDTRGKGDDLHGTLLRKYEGAIDGGIFLKATGECGRECPTVEVDIKTLGVPKDATIEDWTQAIVVVAEFKRVIYSDGHKAEGVEGIVGEDGLSPMMLGREWQ